MHKPDLKRPRILVNVAMSADGKLDTAARQGATLSSTADKVRVDRLRAGVDAVLVGGKTLLAEDPRLTVRSQALRSERLALGLPENPAKAGVVSEIGPQDLPAQGEFLSAGPAQVFLFTTRRTPADVIARLEETGASVTVAGEHSVDLKTVLETLSAAGVRTLLVEGGGTLLAEFFRLDLVDELSVYVAARIFGGASAPTLADGPGFSEESAPRLTLKSLERFDEQGGVLFHYNIVHKE
jgi:2,5-diamino-6-(ribosylamino)-4(3H)-pyrimidinone 5'-phosphate reductase